MEAIKKAGALILKDKNILIVRSKGKPLFITPGGKYENNETAEGCLIRELQEELQVQMVSFKHYKDYSFDKAAYSNYPLFIELYIVKIKGEAKPSSEIEEMQWLSKEDFNNKKFNVAPSFYTFIPDFIKDGLL